MAGIDRTQVIRMDCPKCLSKGYTKDKTTNVEETCASCGGSGMMEKEVPFKFDTNGRWEKDELAAEFEVEISQFKDDGHDIPKDDRDRAKPVDDDE